jgi:hypothetical protein
VRDASGASGVNFSRTAWWEKDLDQAVVNACNRPEAVAGDLPQPAVLCGVQLNGGQKYELVPGGLEPLSKALDLAADFRRACIPPAASVGQSLRRSASNTIYTLQ